ncbi:MAG: hypothetical protein V3T62_03585, partial [Alphaproteobacteria bacterium]
MPRGGEFKGEKFWPRWCGIWRADPVRHIAPLRPSEPCGDRNNLSAAFHWDNSSRTCSSGAEYRDRLMHDIGDTGGVAALLESAGAGPFGAHIGVF